MHLTVSRICLVWHVLHGMCGKYDQNYADNDYPFKIHGIN